LVPIELPHHRPPPSSITSSPVNHGPRQTSTDFCNKIGPSRHFPVAQHFGRFRSEADLQRATLTVRVYQYVISPPLNASRG
jgi:hypothetical protein